MTRVLLIAGSVALALGMGLALHGNPIIGAGVALLSGAIYALGYIDGSARR